MLSILKNDPVNKDFYENYDPKKEFPVFYNSQFVKDCGKLKRWSISNEKKVPIDMDVLETEERMVNLSVYSYPHLKTIDECLEICPVLSNHMFYLQAEVDNYVVLDIEPNCPDDLRQNFLKMNFVYAETSMSGKGLHLVFKLPKCFNEYPNAQTKPAMQEEHKYYEIHLKHNVTFTRNAIDAEPGSEPFEPLFRQMCELQKPPIENIADISGERPEMPKALSLFEKLLFSKSADYNKTLKDHENNNSVYDFNMALHYVKKILLLKDQAMVMKKLKTDGEEFTEEQIIWLVYELLQEKLPHREKHDEQRCGLPYLLHTAKRAYDSYIARLAKKQTENSENKKGARKT